MRAGSPFTCLQAGAAAAERLAARARAAVLGLDVVAFGALVVVVVHVLFDRVERRYLHLDSSLLLALAAVRFRDAAGSCSGQADHCRHSNTTRTQVRNRVTRWWRQQERFDVAAEQVRVVWPVDASR